MFELLDQLLLRLPDCRDELVMRSRCFRGLPPRSPVLFFLPWHTSHWMAQRLGLIGSHYTACYELAPALVSSEPGRCVEAVDRLIDAAEHVLAASGHRGVDITIVGYSLGTYPATLLANRLGARVFAVAAADRGDMMMWESAAALVIRKRALAKGYTLQDFSAAMQGYHPVENLDRLAPGSTFVLSRSDPFIPWQRTSELIAAIRQNSLTRIVLTEGGHLKTILQGAKLLHDELKLPRPQKRLGTQGGDDQVRWTSSA